VTTVEGRLDGQGLHLGIAVASWNQAITDKLLSGAQTRCEELGVSEVTVARVPGALELAVAAMALIEAGCDAVVAIGTIIKGETDHYEIVVRESTSGLTRVATATGVPVANSILAVHDVGHARERAAQGANKGQEAVDAAVLTARVVAELRSGRMTQ
jgi:6,7-dimethyl-8-ribityllumazine synthase